MTRQKFISTPCIIEGVNLVETLLSIEVSNGLLAEKVIVEEYGACFIGDEWAVSYTYNVLTEDWEYSQFGF
jgi:hypothetical protein